MFFINDPHLETISIRTSGSLSPNANESLISVLNKSAALQVVVGVTGVRDMKGERAKGYRSHPRLRSFTFVQGKDLVSNFGLESLATTLLDFLKGYDNIEIVDDGLPTSENRFSWIYHCYQLNDVLLPVLKTRHFRALPAGHVPDYAVQDSTLAQEILRLVEHKDGQKDNWHVIHLREELHLIPETSRALVEASGQGLRSLYTTVRSQLSNTVVQQILGHGRDLGMFGGSVLPELLVSDLLQSPAWSCKFLTVLMVAITGIPRPDVQVDYRDTPIAPSRNASSHWNYAGESQDSEGSVSSDRESCLLERIGFGS